MLESEDEQAVVQATRLLEGVRDRSRCGVCKKYWNTLIDGQRGMLKLVKSSEDIARMQAEMKPVDEAVKTIDKGVEEANAMLGGKATTPRGVFREVLDGMRPRELIKETREIFDIGEGLLGNRRPRLLRRRG